MTSAFSDWIATWIVIVGCIKHLITGFYFIFFGAFQHSLRPSISIAGIVMLTTFLCGIVALYRQSILMILFYFIGSILSCFFFLYIFGNIVSNHGNDDHVNVAPIFSLGIWAVLEVMHLVAIYFVYDMMCWD